MVGYSDARQAFLFANSWGTSWGMQGYAWIPYAYMTNPQLASDMQVLLVQPQLEPRERLELSSSPWKGDVSRSTLTRHR